MKKIIDRLKKEMDKRDSLIYLGIAVGAYCFIFNFIINALMGTNMLLNLILVLGYLVGLVASITLTAGAAYYYLKKVKDQTILILAIDSAIVTLLSLFGIQFVSALISLGSGNYYSILSSYSSWIAGLGIYGWAFYLAYLGAIYSTILCLEMKGIVQIPKIKELYINAPVVDSEVKVDTTSVEEVKTTQPVVEMDTTQPIDTTESTNQEVKEPVLSKEEKTKGSKNKKGLVIGVVVGCLILACGAGYFVYSTFFSSTSVNLVKEATLELSGNDGSGYAIVSAKSDYDGDNEDVKDFLDTVYYKIDDSGDIENGQLSNGQKVKVIASYSEKSADKYKVKVTNDSYELEVTGLITKYTKGKQIPVDILKEMKADTDKKAKDGLLDTSTTKMTIEFDTAYFAGASKYSSSVIMVYKLTTEVNSLAGTGSETTTKYIAYSTSKPKSDYNSDDAYWSTMSLYDNDSKAVSQKEGVKPAIAKKLSIDEDKLEEINMDKAK